RRLLHDTHSFPTRRSSDLRQLTEATLDAIVVASPQGIITLFNPAAERMFGYTTSEIVGQPLTRLMPPEYHERYIQGLDRYMKTRDRKSTRLNSSHQIISYA